ncbi:MAG: hypothetical protein V2A56_13465 [bacterium]
MKLLIMALIILCIPVFALGAPQWGFSLSGQIAFGTPGYDGSWKYFNQSDFTEHAWSELNRTVVGIGTVVDMAPQSPFSVQTELMYRRRSVGYRSNEMYCTQRVLHELSLQPLIRMHAGRERILFGPEVDFLMEEGHYIFTSPMQVILGFVTRLGMDFSLASGWTISPQLGLRMDISSSLRSIPDGFVQEGIVDKAFRVTQSNVRAEVMCQFFMP